MRKCEKNVQLKQFSEIHTLYEKMRKKCEKNVQLKLFSEIQALYEKMRKKFTAKTVFRNSCPL